MQDEGHLTKVLTGLFLNEEERLSLGAMAANQVAQIRGASQKNARYILNLLTKQHEKTS